MPSVSWDDKHGDHANLVQYCKDNGLTMGFIYSKLVKLYLKNPEVIREA